MNTETERKEQMQNFITAAGSALLTVTKLELGLYSCPPLPFGSGLRDDVRPVFSLLTNCCPKLNELRVKGDVGTSLYAQLGQSHKGLSNLYLTEVPTTTVEQLDELMPQVTSTRISLDNLLLRHRLTYQNVLGRCNSLVSLDFGRHRPTAGLWQALPACVQELSFSTISAAEEDYMMYDADADEFPFPEMILAPPAGVKLPNLKKIDIHMQGHHTLSLHQLAGLLRALPSLQELTTEYVNVPSEVEQIPDLVFLHERIKAGFIITVGEQHTVQRFGLILCLTGLRLLHLPESPASLFLAQLPVFNHFFSLDIQPLGNYIPASMAVAFPQLRLLKLHKCDVYESLTAFRSLQILIFGLSSTSKRLSDWEMEALCQNMPWLLHVHNGDPCPATDD